MTPWQIFSPDSHYKLQIKKKGIYYYPEVNASKHACGRIILLVGVFKPEKDFPSLQTQQGILFVEPSQLVLVPCPAFTKPPMHKADESWWKLTARLGRIHPVSPTGSPGDEGWELLHSSSAMGRVTTVWGRRELAHTGYNASTSNKLSLKCNHFVNKDLARNEWFPELFCWIVTQSLVRLEWRRHNA